MIPHAAQIINTMYREQKTMNIKDVDKKKVVALENGLYATVVSVIFENRELCLIVGKIGEDQYVIWDNEGKCDNPAHDIIRILGNE